MIGENIVPVPLILLRFGYCLLAGQESVLICIQVLYNPVIYAKILVEDSLRCSSFLHGHRGTFDACTGAGNFA